MYLSRQHKLPAFLFPNLLISVFGFLISAIYIISKLPSRTFFLTSNQSIMYIFAYFGKPQNQLIENSK